MFSYPTVLLAAAWCRVPCFAELLSFSSVLCNIHIFLSQNFFYQVLIALIWFYDKPGCCCGYCIVEVAGSIWGDRDMVSFIMNS